MNNKLLCCYRKKNQPNETVTQLPHTVLLLIILPTHLMPRASIFIKFIISTLDAAHMGILCMLRNPGSSHSARSACNAGHPESVERNEDSWQSVYDILRMLSVCWLRCSTSSVSHSRLMHLKLNLFCKRKLTNGMNEA